MCTLVHYTVDLASLVTDRTPSNGIPNFAIFGIQWKFKFPQEAKASTLTKNKVKIINKMQTVFIFPCYLQLLCCC